jgi:predicted ribosome-associated RNA-binding protein Tma20
MERFYDLHKSGEWENEVYSLNDALDAIPGIWVKESSLQKIKHGAPVGAEGLIRWDSFVKESPLRLLDPEGTLIAIGKSKINSNEIVKQERGPSIFKIETVLWEMEESVSAVKL